MDVEAIYKDAGALLEGHFLLSSGNHSNRYLQSAKVLEDPKRAEMLAQKLAEMIRSSGLPVDAVCAPALGGVLAGYELARALDVRSIFVERKGGEMELRRGFEVHSGERIIVCEDIITTGGSAMEAADTLAELGADVIAFAALANRGFCRRQGTTAETKPECKLPREVPFFALADFEFSMYPPEACPMCVEGSEAVKPGSRGN